MWSGYYPKAPHRATIPSEKVPGGSCVVFRYYPHVLNISPVTNLLKNVSLPLLAFAYFAEVELTVYVQHHYAGEEKVISEIISDSESPSESR